MSSRDKQTIAEQQERIDQLQTWIESEGEPTRLRCEQLQLQCDSMEQELSQKCSELDCLRLELKSFRKDYKSLHILYKQVSNDKAQISDELESAIESLTDLSQQKQIRKELEEKSERLKQQNYILLNEGTKMLDKLTKSEGLNAILQRDATQYIKQMEEMKTDHTTFRRRIKELKSANKQKNNDLKARDDHIEKLNEKLAAIHDHRHRLTAMISMDTASQSEFETEHQRIERKRGQKSKEMIDPLKKARTLSPHPDLDEEWSTEETVTLQMANDQTEEMGSFELAMRVESVLVDNHSTKKMEMEMEGMRELLVEYSKREDKWREEVQRLNDEVSELRALDALKREIWDSTTSSNGNLDVTEGATNTTKAKRRKHRRDVDEENGIVCADVSWRWRQFASMFGFTKK